MSITQDATSLWYVPANASEWTSLLAGTGIAIPSNLWLCQESSGNLADSIGTVSMVASGSPAYRTSVTGWSRKAISFPTTNSDFAAGVGNAGNIQTHSCLLLGLVSITGTPSATQDVFGLGNGTTYRGAQVTTTPAYKATPNDGSASATGSANTGTSVRPVLLLVDRTNQRWEIVTDQETIRPSPWTAPPSSGGNVFFGFGLINSDPSTAILYAALWEGATGELTDGQLAQLISYIKNGPLVSTTTSYSIPQPVGFPRQIGVGGPRLSAPRALQAFAIAGAIVNTAGAAIAGAAVKLFDSSTDRKLQQTTSAADGTFSFTTPHNSGRFYVVAYLAGSPDTTGSTRNDLTPQVVGVGKPASQFNVILKPGQAVPTTLMLGTPTATATAPTAVAGTTLAALQAGSTAYKYVVAIEGYPYLLSDATPAAVLAAWSGYDWQQVIGGLYVELDNEQRMHPWEPFQPGGRCTLRVVPDAVDQFGIDTHRMASGPEALLVAPLDRGGSQLGGGRKIIAGQVGAVSSFSLPYATIDQNPGFVAGDAWIGTECIELASADATHVYIRQRGKYSPFGTAGQGYYGSGLVYGQGQAKAGGGGGDIHFAEYHRVAADAQAVLLQPTVSQQPRVWIGRRVGVWMHKVDGNGNLNSRANAQLVYAGRVAQIMDDPNTFATAVELKHVNDEIKDATIGHDMYTATITEGIYLVQGRTFAFYAWDSTNTLQTANVLNVVAPTATQDANDVPAGYYTCDQLCEIFNTWITSEYNATRLKSVVTWKINSSGSAMRCQGRWISTTNFQQWQFVLPGEVASFLGFYQNTGNGGPSAFYGSTLTVGDQSTPANQRVWEGQVPPLRTSLFRTVQDSTQQAGLGSSFYFQMSVEDARGTAVDQSAWIPSSMSGLPALWPTKKFGLFLIDESLLVVAGFDVQATTTTFSPVFWANFAMPGIANAQSGGGGGDFESYGRSWGDTAGPITVRQVFILEGQFAAILKALFYSTGTTGYNHPTYDTLGFGIGLGVPGNLLGTAFEASVDRLPGAKFPCALVIDKATKVSDLLSADLILRHAFPIFRNGHVSFAVWQTPTNDLATVTLSESNKAEPAAHLANHRTATVLTDQWQRNVVKIQYNRDITLGKGGQYLNEMTLEDHVSVDDQGADAKPVTIQCRNTYSQYQGTGAGVESLFPGFLTLFPLFSRPVHWLTRSIDVTNYEGVAPGDVALVSDTFARDPATGTRGIGARAALITRVRYNPGGPIVGDPTKKAKPMVGEVDLFFLDLHRWTQYAPSAQVDDTANANGFSSGYNAATWTLATYANAYSEPGTNVQAAEPVDASRFAALDFVVVVEIDPASLASPKTWRVRLTAVSGTQLQLAAPLQGWDATKYYRVLYDSYANVAASQQGKAFEASAATGKIAGVALPYQLSSVPETITITQNSPLNETPAELVPPFAYGDGKPHDVGHERSLIRTINALHDGKTLHQQPWMYSEGGAATSEISDGGGATRTLAFIRPIFLGADQLSQAVARSLNVSLMVLPLGVYQVWVTLTTAMPTTAPGSAGSLVQISFPGPSSTVSWSYTVAAATWQIAGPQTINIANNKDRNGLAFLVLEHQGTGKVKGFTQLVEGFRSA